jgi:hypothetical protein
MENVKTFDQLLYEKYGKKGNIERDQFDARRTCRENGHEKSYIYRIERGSSDIQISTYYKLIEIGLGKQLDVSIG